MIQDTYNEDIFIVEPHIKDHNVFKLSRYKEAIEKEGIVVFLIAHDKFKTVAISEEKLILDFCGVREKK